MEKIKVCKFGGTSMASAAAIKNAEDIVRSDPSRKLIVVSAPGKRFKDDEKVTDLFYKAFEYRNDCEAFGRVFKKIEERFDEIIRDLGIGFDLKSRYENIRENIKLSETPDYAASRGEYLSALIFAKYLGFEFIDTKDLIFFDERRNFDPEYTNLKVQERLKGAGYAVLPGFYGSLYSRKRIYRPLPEYQAVVTFSRGGSDVTGSIIARAASAELYENWTDVDGFLTADPRVVKNPKLIDRLSYKELRELSYMGASVLHHEAIFPLKASGIPINVRNTFDKSKDGTLILPAKDLPKSNKVITGIAGKKGYSVIHIEKSLLNNEIGFVRKVLSVLEEHGVSFEHMPTGIDTMSIVLADSELGHSDKLLAEISRSVAPDTIALAGGLSLIAVVGHGMARKKGTAAKVCAALYESDVNIMMIDQGSSELNIIVAVDTKDYERAINAIYNAFFCTD